jgi:hypothetical protein
MQDITESSLVPDPVVTADVSWSYSMIDDIALK